MSFVSNIASSMPDLRKKWDPLGTAIGAHGLEDEIDKNLKGPSAPTMPGPVAPPPAPGYEDAAFKAEQVGKELGKRQGRASTILTGMQGAGQPQTATKALLGS